MNRLKNMNTVKKVLILSILFLAIPTLIFSIFLYDTQTKQFYSQLTEKRRIAIEQLSENVNTTITAASELSRDLVYRTPLSNLLERSNLEKFPIWSTRNINDITASVRYSLKYQNLGITRANIYFFGDSLSEDSCFLSVNRIKTLDFYTHLEQTAGSASLYFLSGDQAEKYFQQCHNQTVTGNAETMLLIRKVFKDEPNICIGYLIFEMPPSEALPMLSSSASTSDNYFAWFANTGEYYGSSASDALLENISQSPLPIHTVTAGEEQYMCETISRFHIVIADSQPLSKTPFVRSALNLSLILIWLLVAQMLILNLLIKSVFSRLNSDLNQMDTIVAQEFRGRIPVHREDEVGQIARRYNLLLDKIDVLVSDLVKKETANTTAQLKALQYQINPHFIYNTLNIFSGYAGQNGNEELAESIASFGHLLRYNIKNDGLYSTVGKELDNAEALIRIYAIRYFNQLKIEIDAPPAVRDMRLIKFLIQPIIENSILHGLVPPHTDLLIQITVHTEKNYLHISIADNGAGMSAERLTQVQEGLNGSLHEPSTATGSFIGLSNISERLRLFYGDETTFKIDSLEDTGTCIFIKIPIDHNPKEGP